MCKKLTIALAVLEIALIIWFCFAGCTQAGAESKLREAFIRSPDGTCISGKCDSIQRISSGWVGVVIDGVSYWTNEKNVLIVEK